MAETSPTLIPIIDLENFPGESKKLIEACENWGCFRVANHKIPLSLMSDMKSVSRSLLDLPAEMKQKNIDSKPKSGYIKPTDLNRMYESLGLYDITSEENVNLFCTQLDASEHQRDTICAYMKGIQELAMDIAGKIAEALGVTDESFEDWLFISRINKYNFKPDCVGLFGVSEHTDNGFFTILHDDDNVGGLEAMDKRGTYVRADPMPGTFFVNIGDVGKIWSNGRFCSVKHRVVCREANIRVSLANFFLGPKIANVEPRKELISEENPPLYRPIPYEEFRTFRISHRRDTGEALELLRIKPPVANTTE